MIRCYQELAASGGVGHDVETMGLDNEALSLKLTVNKRTRMLLLHADDIFYAESKKKHTFRILAQSHPSFIYTLNEVCCIHMFPELSITSLHFTASSMKPRYAGSSHSNDHREIESFSLQAYNNVWYLTPDDSFSEI